jgi:glycosyltransferase involved in cell wall biosynthesis
MGVHAEPGALLAVRARYQLPPDARLLLYVGGISPHKNLQALLRAAARLDPQACGEWHVVLVGDYKGDSFLGCYEELASLVRSLGISGRVTFTGFVSDEDLVLLYNTATMLVLPSRGEGFGLPVLEAMACGCPVLAADNSSLPEVGGDAALYPSTQDAQAYAHQLQRLEGSALREQLVAAGLQRARQFPWAKTLQQTVALYR